MKNIEGIYGPGGGKQTTSSDLVMEHLSLVGKIVGQLPPEITEAVPEEELVSAGVLGLVEAAHRYRDDGGASFVTFAYRRIRGAIIDCLREHGYLSKDAAEQCRKVKRYVSDYYAEHGVKPSVEEISQGTGLSRKQVLRAIGDDRWNHVRSLSAELDDDSGTLLGALVAVDSSGPLEEAERKELVERLGEAISRLPEQERKVIVLYYYEELPMGRIADIMGVTKGRVSQLHTKALYDLGRLMEVEDAG